MSQSGIIPFHLCQQLGAKRVTKGWCRGLVKEPPATNQPLNRSRRKTRPFDLLPMKSPPPPRPPGSPVSSCQARRKSKFAASNRTRWAHSPRMSHDGETPKCPFSFHQKPPFDADRQLPRLASGTPPPPGTATRCPTPASTRPPTRLGKRWEDEAQGAEHECTHPTYTLVPLKPSWNTSSSTLRRCHLFGPKAGFKL